VVISQGEIWWADLPAPAGVGRTHRAMFILPARITGLPKDSVANVSQILALDKDLLTEPAGKLQRAKLELLGGIDVVLGK
jgi:mRNA-degrading endonuclease toxin of MazEF toxin-antitoxin module